MEQTYKSFTFKADGILRDLKTPCGVCPAFDPLSEKERPEVTDVTGLWDTGAIGTAINKGCAQKIGLRPIGDTKSFHAGGVSIVHVYEINLFLPNNVAFPFVKVAEHTLNGIDLLIGMDIITKGDFAITNLAGKTTFSFRVPSMETLDFVKRPDNSITSEALEPGKQKKGWS